MRQKFWWIARWHYYVLRHKCGWFLCGDWITSVECYTCNKRWEA